MGGREWGEGGEGYAVWRGGGEHAEEGGRLGGSKWAENVTRWKVGRGGGSGERGGRGAWEMEKVGMERAARRTVAATWATER